MRRVGAFLLVLVVWLVAMVIEAVCIVLDFPSKVWPWLAGLWELAGVIASERRA